MKTTVYTHQMTAQVRIMQKFNTQLPSGTDGVAWLNHLNRSDDSSPSRPCPRGLSTSTCGNNERNYKWPIPQILLAHSTKLKDVPPSAGPPLFHRRRYAIPRSPHTPEEISSPHPRVLLTNPLRTVRRSRKRYSKRLEGPNGDDRR